MTDLKNTVTSTSGNGELLKINFVIKVEHEDDINKLLHAGFKILDVYKGKFVLGHEDKDAIRLLRNFQ